MAHYHPDTPGTPRGVACKPIASSHYPSTSELAAFRRSIEGPHHTLVASPDHGGAWSYEREHGIGYRPHRDLVGVSDLFTRREASAMRSRAYAAWQARGAEVCRQLRGWPIASDQGNCPEGHPCHLLPDGATRACGTCSYFGQPVYDAPFWDDDQPRSPLPIAYRNPISAA